MNKSKVTDTKVHEWLGYFNELAPFDWAEDWDNVGLLCGDHDAIVTGVVIAVNLGADALQRAKECGANLIICHHPPIFKPMSKLVKGSSPYLFESARLGINVIALHTNYDLAAKQANQKLCLELGADYTEPLAGRSSSSPPPSNSLAKFVTYIPQQEGQEKYVDLLRESLSSAGAGKIGNYSQCSFTWQGEGSFMGSDQSKPTIGEKMTLEKVAETRLEMIFPMKRLKKIVQAAKKVHPYEEMAYDILPLAQEEHTMGYGFVGRTSQSFGQLLDKVKSYFQQERILWVPGFEMDLAVQPNETIKKIAYSPGSGTAFISAAAAKGVDVYITGEVGYHQMLDARRQGVSLMIVGHSYSERPFLYQIHHWCEVNKLGQVLLSKGGKIEIVFEMIHQVI